MVKTTMPRRFIILDDNTVREKRDHQEQRRPRKRQRVDSDDENAGKSETLQNRTPQNVKIPSPYAFFNPDPVGNGSKEPPERDPVYFDEDSHMRVFVGTESTLFKIHRELLDCSQTMQDLLLHHEKRRGRTTEFSPLYLERASTVECRAFLWALHASADELQEPPTSDEDLVRLFNVAGMTAKYDSPKMADWVSEMILRSAKNSSLMDACSSATLSLFVDAAVDRKYDAALELVIDKWCDRLVGKSTPSVPAIQVADKHEEVGKQSLKKLRGIAYYVHVQDMLDRQTDHAESGATHLRTDPKLNNGQVMRLLAGYWSLVTFWERLRLNPIRFPRASDCSDDLHEKCCSVWSRRWSSAVGWKRIMGHNSADVLALLEILRDQLSNDDDLRSGLHADCRRGGLDEIRKFREKTKAELADHFSGCL